MRTTNTRIWFFWAPATLSVDLEGSIETPVTLRISNRAAAIIFAVLAFAIAPPAWADTAHYGLVISEDATQNVSFSGGVFSATSDDAILNIADLENALGNGPVTVTTGSGSGGTHKGDLHVEAPLSWTSKSSLTLDAYHSIFVSEPISDSGPGALTLKTNNGGVNGDLRVGRAGNIAFMGTGNNLIINNDAFTLVDSLKSLAQAESSNPSGRYALAHNYDAGIDGKYSKAPVKETLTGTFEGLGNVISNLKITPYATVSPLGLFAKIGRGGTVRDIGITAALISNKRAGHGDRGVGIVAGGIDSGGAIYNSYATGEIRSAIVAEIGGLVGINRGKIRNAMRVS